MPLENGLIFPEDIPNKFPFCSYAVDIGFDYMLKWIDEHNVQTPKWQRPLVRTREQQISWIEYIARGGISGKNIFCNSVDFEMGGRSPIYVVDGQQRLQAAKEFLDGKFKIFEKYYAEDLRLFAFHRELSYRRHINNYKSEKEVINWYLNLNNGGTYHTKEDIEKAKTYLESL